MDGKKDNKVPEKRISPPDDNNIAFECQIHVSLADGKNRVLEAPTQTNFMGGGRGGGGGFGQGGPGGDTNDGPPVNLNDVGGLTEEINFIKRSVLFPLANKDTLAKWGFIPPKGIIFHGSPGTGKTLLAKAIASELTQNMRTKVKFIYRKGTDCHSKYFGESSANLREIFKDAERNKPALIFFDEIDGLCPNRDSSTRSSEVYASVVTTFLGMMDSIKNGEVFVIGATNRLESLDPALRRPGRFDKELRFNPPDEDGRKIILRIHTRKWKANSQPSENLLSEIATATSGFTGAYLENLCSQTSNCAVKRYKMVYKVEMMTTAHLSQVVIGREDWHQALREIGRPKTNLFGSVLYIPQSEAKVESLVTAQVEGIKRKMLKTNPFDENFKTLKTFLVYGPSSTASTYIIPHLLSSKEFEKIRTYKLSLESVTRNFHLEVGNILNQVLSSTDPCILYLPNCCTLFTALSATDQKHKTAYLDFLINKLQMTASRPVLILGTSNVAPCNFPLETREIFPGSLNYELSYKLKYPTEEERRAFFNTVLRRDAYAGGAISSQKGDPFFQNTLDACVKTTANNRIDELVELHSNLYLTGRRFMADEKRFMIEMDQLVKNYKCA